MDAVDDVGKQRATTIAVWRLLEGRNDVLLRCVVSFLWCLEAYPLEGVGLFASRPYPYPADLFVRQHAVLGLCVVICWRANMTVDFFFHYRDNNINE
jgi:hypothetical protein